MACKKTKDEGSNSSVLKVTAVSPANGAEVEAGKDVQFTWSSSSNTAVPITHNIKIVEVTEDQSPEQAIGGNKPIFEKDSLNYIVVVPYVPASAGAPSTGFVVGKKYAWQVTAIQDKLVTTGGISAVSVFTVVR